MTPDIKREPTPDTPRQHKPNPARRRVTVMAFGFLFLVLAFLMMAEDTIDVTENTAPPAMQLVSIETILSGFETAVVSAFAEVRPRWSAELRAAVSGRVTDVTSSALAGERVKKDEVLVKIESSQYQAEVASAEYALEQARLSLRKAQNNTAIARREFDRDGTKPPSDLALHLPELKIAQSALASTQARLASSKRQLTDATVSAPFSGYITNRFVSPGETVNVGDRLVKIVDDKTFELTVELGHKERSLLPSSLIGQKAQILDGVGKLITSADIRQVGGFLDEKTRLYKVFLEITETESNRLLSGDFVRVVLPGIKVPNALSIPESSLSQEGYFWYLDETDRLQRISPEVLFRTQGRIIIEAPDESQAWRIAITPLASFLPGQLVRAHDAQSTGR